jgi:hypothetical protein
VAIISPKTTLFFTFNVAFDISSSTKYSPKGNCCWLRAGGAVSAEIGGQ